MEFRLAFNPIAFQHKIQHQHKLFLAGSCFTEQIGAKLSYHKFDLLDNPNGILFNPVSIANAIENYINNKTYTTEELFLHQELWGSWDHHTKFSSLSQEECLSKINHSQQKANSFLKNADWLLLTLGSAFVYELPEGRIVANCHKVPTDKFNKRLLSTNEITATLVKLIAKLHEFNPKLKIIFTISPVRHLRDGFIENNRSKANLIQAVHELVNIHSTAFYFPAYELIIDDLRDYRFYAEDMVHPNYQATQYVWEKFMHCCIDEKSLLLMKEISTIKMAKNHHSFQPKSNQHQQFLKISIEKAQGLQKQFAHLNFEEELAYFNSFLL
jgi:hypothetical protein